MRSLRLLALASVAAAAWACEPPLPIWIPHGAADPLYRFVKDGKAGYIDGNGKIVIPPSLPAYNNFGGEFHEGLLQVKFGEGRYVDRTGKVVINREVFPASDFSEGLAVARRKDEKIWGLIDTSGKFAIPPRIDRSVGSFSEGLAIAEVRGKAGYIDHSGEFVIKPEFVYGTSFHDGVARIAVEGPCVFLSDGPCKGPVFIGGRTASSPPPCKFAYIDKKGNRIGQSTFDAGRDFSEGLAPVKIGKLWGFIDKSGAVVIPAKFEDAEPYSSGLSRIRKGDLYGYVNKLGEVVIPAQFKYGENFSERVAVVRDARDHFWYIDVHGKRAIPGEFAEASPFFKGLADVLMFPREAARFAYIDKTGRQVFTY